ARPVAVSVEKPQALSGTIRGLMPRRLKARPRLRPCQSLPSPNMTMAASLTASARMDPSGERARQHCVVDAPALEALAGLERRHRHHGRAEQHAVDRIEIALHRREDVGERLAVI